MRWLLPILCVAACDPLPPGEVDAPPCEEIVDPLRPGERTFWGTTASQVRVRLGGTHTGALTLQRDVPLDLVVEWPAGLEASVWAAPNVEPDPVPPGWCADGLDLPAGLVWTTPDGPLAEPARVAGRLRAVGAVAELTGGFTGTLPREALPALLPDAVDPAEVEIRVWASWGPEAMPAGTLRMVPVGADPVEAGDVLGAFGP